VGADPIFLGAEGLSGLKHALIGSVSEVLRHANRTMLVVDGHPESESAKCGSLESERAGTT
jgi:nucleotide-binding universal stress UspA family protein